MKQRGFALPVIIFMSTAIMIAGLATLQVVVSLRAYGLSQYYIKIAEEAAEAGTIYASACLENNNRTQTWGADDNNPVTTPNPLTQDTYCDGTDYQPGTSVLVANDSRIKTEFIVGNLDYVSSNATQVYSVQISAKGFAKIKTGATSSVTKTYQATVKKTIVWNTSLNSSRSVSGTYRTCTIMSGSVYCWGRNARGQLGNGQSTGGNPENSSSADSYIPVKVRKDTGVLAGKVVDDMFAAQFHNCALASGKVYCWGWNNNGQLGQGNTTDSSVPVEVKGALLGKTVTAIGGSGNTSCAIAEGKIYCWGSNSSGTVGVNTTTSYYTTPQLVVAGNTSTTLPSSYTATKLSTSGSRSYLMCAIADGKAYCWGPNEVGQVGDGTTTTPRRLPTKVLDTGVLSGKTITSISQDGYIDSASGAYPHVCVVANGSLYCWGENNSGQLGRAAGNTTDSSSPVAVYASGVLSGKTIQDVGAGLRHTCALAGGEVYCWGLNSSGQVGDNTTTTRYVPVKVYQETNVLQGITVNSIGAGANRGCAVTANAKAFCWGLNSDGQIGDGTLINRKKPTESLFLRPKNNQYIY